MKNWYMECPFCANEIKEGAKKCMYCKEYLNIEAPKENIKEESKEVKNVEDDKKTSSVWWRVFVVLYFIITVPIFLFICILIFNDFSRIWLSIPDNSYWGYHWKTVHNYYNFIFWIIVAVLIYILITNFIRRICSFISKWTFAWFINYRNIFKKYRIILLILLAVLVWTYVLWSRERNKYECLQWEVLNDNLDCVCDWQNDYEMVDWRCQKWNGIQINDEDYDDLDLRGIFDDWIFDDIIIETD